MSVFLAARPYSGVCVVLSFSVSCIGGQGTGLGGRACVCDVVMG